MATGDRTRDNRQTGKRHAERDENESFLSRWSQRKRAAEAAPEEGDRPREETAVAAEAAEEGGGAIDPAELPDIDSMDANSDFTVFLKEGVPDALRRRALRKLWRLDPVFGHLDGLNDYDLDYTNAATVVEGLKTIYQVGKGMVTGEEEGGDKKKDGETVEGAPVEALAEDGEDDEATATQLEGPDAASAEASGPVAGDPAGARRRGRNPGDPLVSAAPTPRRQTVRGPQRSAAQRRWGDPEA